MEIADFITMLEGELDGPAGQVKPEAQFRQLDGWSSMTALIVIAGIDANYNVTISAQDLAAVRTVEELYGLVKSRM